MHIDEIIHHFNHGEMAWIGMHRGYCLHSIVASRESGPRHTCGASDGGGHRMMDV